MQRVRKTSLVPGARLCPQLVAGRQIARHALHVCMLPLLTVAASLQVVETGAALTWAFFAFPTCHFDEKTPLLQARSNAPCTLSCKIMHHCVARRKGPGLEAALRYTLKMCRNAAKVAYVRY